MCRVLEVAPSGYYAWRKRRESQRAQEDQTLLERIQQIHRASRQTYGRPRIRRALRTAGIRCGERRVGRLMRQSRLRGIQRKRHRVAPKDRGAAIADNVLGQRSAVTRTNEVWVADITYLPTAQGWLYLAIVLDLFSRRVVGWSMSTAPDSELTLVALRMAVLNRHPDQELLHHSDRGVQYSSRVYQAELQRHGIMPSMSRKGHCWDNAVAESFFATLKLELDRGMQFVTRAAARTAVFEFIEAWYNRRRLHSSLGYTSPETFEAQLT